MKLHNKEDPNGGIEGGFSQLIATRGDPDIGRYKRGRAPCKVYDVLIASRLTGSILPEWERYIQLIRQLTETMNMGSMVNKSMVNESMFVS